jgi:hypothetical protein
VSNLFPVQVKKIEIKNYHDFQKGEFDGTNIDGMGRLFIGPQVKSIKGPASEYYLALELAKNGDILIGTGHKASVYRVKASSGETEEIFSSPELDVYALLARQNNEIYVGTSPNGKIYKVNKDKKLDEVADFTEKIIWDMVEDRQGNVFCAVGSEGGVYQIKAPGEISNIFQSEDSHIVSLYVTKNNALLAGSGDRGVLYRIENRKVKVLFDAPFEEIKGIDEDPEGNIYFSASRGVRAYGDPPRERIEPTFNGPKGNEKKPTKDKCALYRRSTNGVVEKIWSSKTEYIYSIYYDKTSKSILAATGNSGRVYKVEKDKSFSLLHESEAAQIFKIKGNRAGITFITNNTATITQIQQTLNTKGTYFTKIFDLKVPSRFGRLYWDAEQAAGTQVQFFARVGNSNIPDKTWTEWSPPFNNPQNSNIGLAGYRYIQFKIVLNSTNTGKSPLLNSLKSYYIQSNLTPQVKSVVVQRNTPKSQSGQKDKVKPNSKSLAVEWSAVDPNGDTLKYNVFLRKVGDKKWIPFKTDVTSPKTRIPTELYEDGSYTLKITADDSLSNPPSQSRSHTLTSQSFLIDSTAPVLGDFALQTNQMTFTVIDNLSVVKNVLYSFDGKLWFPLAPTDMIADSSSESFKVSLNKLIRKGKNVIFLKLIDEFDNTKVYQKEL